jgi:hypothetical protein
VPRPSHGRSPSPTGLRYALVDEQLGGARAYRQSASPPHTGPESDSQQTPADCSLEQPIDASIEAIARIRVVAGTWLV